MSDAPSETSAFELSRAYGEGWKAAKKLLALALGDIDPGEIAARNPHCSPEKRARWMQGFTEGIGAPVPAITKRRGISWRKTR